MKVFLIGADHKAEEAGIEVTVEYDGEDTWTFSSKKFNFSISDLTKTAFFLKDEPNALKKE